MTRTTRYWSLRDTDIYEEARSMASLGTGGTWIDIRATIDSLDALGLTEDAEDDFMFAAWSLLVETPDAVAGRRMAWRRLLVLAPRDDEARLSTGRRLFELLTTEPSLSRVTWNIVVSVFDQDWEAAAAAIDAPVPGTGAVGFTTLRWIDDRGNSLVATTGPEPDSSDPES